jgi:hypothetical protein
MRPLVSPDPFASRWVLGYDPEAGDECSCSEGTIDLRSLPVGR